MSGGQTGQLKRYTTKRGELRRAAGVHRLHKKMAFVRWRLEGLARVI